MDSGQEPRGDVGGWSEGRMGDDECALLTRAGARGLGSSSLDEQSQEYVYVIGSHDRPLVKIGRTVSLVRRLGEIQRMSPAKLEILWFTAGGVDLELALHDLLRSRREHGEWFRFDSSTEALRAVVAAALEALGAIPQARPARPPTVPKAFKRRPPVCGSFDEEVFATLPSDAERFGASAIAVSLGVDRGRVERSLRRLAAEGRVHHDGSWCGWAKLEISKEAAS